MTPFGRISSHAVWIRENHIDTDVIFPARFLLIMDRDGLDKHLFFDRRFDRDGAPVADHPIDAPEAQGAQVLIAGDGFGCGSSREQAVWALGSHGFRVIIAPGFGEIFAANCLKNGLLPIVVPEIEAERLGMAASQGAVFDVCLDDMHLRVDGEAVTRLTLGERQREAMINGWDETDLLLREDGDHIKAFEARHRIEQPWLYVNSQE